jgi:hypothetical protein
LPAAVKAEWELKQFPLSHGSCRQPQKYVKAEAAVTVFEFLMMSGLSLETFNKLWNNKFYYTVASFWLFLYVLYYDTRIHDHQMTSDLVFVAVLNKHLPFPIVP